MSGLVGAFGNLGGMIFVLVFRLQTDVGKACWIFGTMYGSECSADCL